MTAYYNEIDKDACHVLRCLIADGLIAPGDVDDRSIKDVQPDDLAGYTQCHFFAGAGVWSLAARMAGWPDDRPLWTGSCPCQPHSSAASERKRGFGDDRDLWPIWFSLIRQCAPDVVAGEQVDDSAAWIDRMLADLESESFAIGALDLPACAVDAPIVRMRTYFVAVANSAGCREQGRPVAVAPEHVPSERAGRGSRFGRHTTTGELGKLRRSEPGISILAHGMAGRVPALRLGGNAIVAPLAAEVLRAFLDTDAERIRLTELSKMTIYKGVFA